MWQPEDSAPIGESVLLRLEKDGKSETILSRKSDDGRWTMGLSELLSGAKPMAWAPIPS